MTIKAIENLEVLSDHTKWFDNIFKEACEVLENLGELPDQVFFLACDNERGYVEMSFPLEMVQNGLLGPKIKHATEKEMDLIAVLSVINSTWDDQPSVLFILETEEDLRVRAFHLDKWESGKLVFGSQFPWLPEKETAEIPCVFPRKNLN